jgi:hypothetical protein
MFKHQVIDEGLIGIKSQLCPDLPLDMQSWSSRVWVRVGAPLACSVLFLIYIPLTIINGVFSMLLAWVGMFRRHPFLTLFLTTFLTLLMSALIRVNITGSAPYVILPDPRKMAEGKAVPHQKLYLWPSSTKVK